MISSATMPNSRADRVGHFARHHGDRDRHRMAGAQAAHDDVERVGKLRAELLLPPPAQDAQHQIGQRGAAEQADQQRLERDLPRKIKRDGERCHRADRDEDQQLADADASGRTAEPAG